MTACLRSPKGQRLNAPVLDRLLRLVEADPNGGCWLWSGAVTRDGYGYMQVAGKKQRAHRLAFEALVGPISNDLIVCHRCDNRACCNPGHLFLGTVADNNSDKMQKGRFRPTPGECSGRARLTDRCVLDIRACSSRGESDAAIGRRFHVSESTIQAIRVRRTWKHLPQTLER